MFKKYLIIVVFLLVIFKSLLFCVTDNPLLIFLQDPRKLYWAIDYQLRIVKSPNCQNIGRAIAKAVNIYTDSCLFSSNNNLWIKDYVNIHGFVLYLLDCRVDEFIVKLNNGYLSRIVEKRSDADLIEFSDKTLRFKQFLDARNIPLLYVQYPYKIHKIDSQLPRGLKDYSNENVDRFLQLLKDRGISYYDSRELLLDTPTKHYNIFFRGDNHWTDEYALLVFRQIAKLIYTPEEFSYNEKYLERDNFVEKIEPFPWFKQSRWKAVGKYYPSGFKETQVVLLPKKYPYSESIFNRETKRLHWEKDVVEYSFLDKTKPTPIGNKQRKRILLVRDSFSNYMTNFFGCMFSEVTMIDLRRYSGSLEDYIEQNKPDYVVIAFTPSEPIRRCMYRFDKPSSEPENCDPGVN